MGVTKVRACECLQMTGQSFALLVCLLWRAANREWATYMLLVGRWVHMRKSRGSRSFKFDGMLKQRRSLNCLARPIDARLYDFHDFRS